MDPSTSTQSAVDVAKLNLPTQSPMADFHSGSILDDAMDDLTLSAADNKAEAAVNQKMCGYTVWVQWCDATELHGYNHCVGLRNDRFHFVSRRDAKASLFADSQGFWYLMYDGQCLYKSKGRGHEDPPPRSWRCIEGSLPPPGVSTVDLPEDSRPMVLVDDRKRTNKVPSIVIPDDMESSMESTPKTSRAVTVKSIDTPLGPGGGGRSPYSVSSPGSRNKKKRKKKVLNL